jgi:proteasome lid subunit RPN8/RPN11
MSWLREHPWVAGGLRITRSALDELSRDAVRGYREGEEACGYLAGPADDPLLCDRAVPVTNLARVLHERDPAKFFRSPRTFFAFHERTLESAIREGRALGAPVKILYHSHLDVGAYLSGTDAAVLSRGTPPAAEGGRAVLGPGPAWPLAFLVSSVRMGAAEPIVDDHRLFVWRDRAFVDSSFEIVDV